MFCILLEYLIYAMTRAHKGLPIHDQFKSEQNQVTLGADCVLKLNQIQCWRLGRGENQSTSKKNLSDQTENQQNQLTYKAEAGNRTRG